MKLSKFRVIATTLALSCASVYTHAEDSMLRIRCDEVSEGAQIYINGVIKGECPLNIQVAPGTVKLRARKNVDADHERVFEQEMLIGGGVLKSIYLQLPEPQLTEKARQAQQLAAQHKAAEDLARAIQAKRQAAEAGDPAAMEELARRYTSGDGVEKNPAQAQAWRSKAVAAEIQRGNAGDIAAMDSLAARYTNGNGVKADATEAESWRNKATSARQAQAAQAQARLRQQQREQELKKLSFVYFTTEILNPDSEHWKQFPPERRPMAYSSCSTLMLPYGILSDVTSTPMKISKLKELRSEAAMRPASWANPDSMVAKAAVLNRVE